MISIMEAYLHVQVKLGYNITVLESPQLEVLNFLKIWSLSSLHIAQATALTRVSLPQLSSGKLLELSDGSSMNGGGVLSLNITETPFLTDFTIQNTTYFADLILIDSGVDWAEGRTTGLSDALETVNAAISIQTDICVGFYPHGISLGLSSLRINGSMILENSVLPRDLASLGNTIDLSQVTSAGWDVNITANSNVNIDFGKLESVGRNLAVQNNTNCIFNFKQITQVGNLLATDNPNTTLPIFSNLERADSVHLRGYIDTSDGPNIFPALTYVPGTIIIEAWNDDFNCSKLVAQWHDRIINNLTCNGTDNGTDNAELSGNATNTSASEPQGSLSRGAWAGIGVGIGIVVLAAIVAMAWLVIHFRRRLHKLEIAHPQQSFQGPSGVEPAQPHQSERAEVEAARIIREKPDDSMREMHAPAIPAEKPND
ncbi:hypothetical protein F5Y06DRAFT_302289 [Hypoxylon sp. FL0890]|nr:hypothetical protein F5Y06DRAFT_302289 [Hypoxylon sp. FL0890]